MGAIDGASFASLSLSPVDALVWERLPESEFLACVSSERRKFGADDATVAAAEDSSNRGKEIAPAIT
jgi:hypothetical protein